MLSLVVHLASSFTQITNVHVICINNMRFYLFVSKAKRTNADDEKYIQKYEQICGELKENKAKLKDKQEQLKDTL